jgi:hypothetical protein
MDMVDSASALNLDCHVKAVDDGRIAFPIAPEFELKMRCSAFPGVEG